jgi:hypothetical protein
MITIYFLTSDFVGNCSPNNRNNLEWLRKQDRINGTFNIAAPYPKDDYFRRTFIEPILDDDMFIKEEMFDRMLVNRDGISYIIKKWNVNQPSERL